MFRFEHTDLLYALIIIPVIGLLYYLMRRMRRKKIAGFGEIRLMEHLMPDVSAGKAGLKFFMILFSLILVILGLSNPQIGSKLEEVKREGVDLVIALDISNSMLAEDIQPNRIERAKQAISRLTDKLRGDQIGIIVFAGKPFVQLPVTFDYSAAKLFIHSISPDIIPIQGTALGAAIDLSMESLSYHDDEKQKGRNRAIIVISDGENHEDDALGSAQRAAADGIVVHTIGMGSPEGAPIPVYRNGVQAGFHKDNEGNTIITKMNETMLQQIAAAGNGIYLRGASIETGLSALFAEINRMEKKEIGSKIFTDYEDRFQYLLLPALILLILELIISERKSKWLSKIKVYGWFVLAMIFIPAASIAQGDRKYIRQGNEQYKNGKFNDAEINYRKALDKNSKTKEGIFNLGDALYKQGNYSEAAKHFETIARSATDKETQAKAWHNLGNAQLNEKKYNESIHSFKQSLKLNSKDDETRYNLAYAMKMLQQQLQQQQQQQQNQDKKEDQKKEQQEQQQKQDEKKEDQQQKPKPDGNKQQEKEEQEKDKISRENAQRLLDAMNNEEKDVQDKVRKQMMKGEKRVIEKDW